MSLQWAGVILFNRKGELLLLLRDDIPSIGHPNHWNLVGGGIEDGESPAQAAIRETEEEIGVRLDEVPLFRLYSIACEHTPGLVHPYYVHWSRLERPIEDLTLGEGQEMRFFPPGELSGLRIIPHEVGILQDFLASPYYVREAP